VAAGCAKVAAQSFLQTTGNVIVEVMRREGSDIELRLTECRGLEGSAGVTLYLPHSQAARTDLTGGHPQKLEGGPVYTFPVKPQEIVTLRFRADAPVEAAEPLLDWSELVPTNKLAALHRYLPDVIGHPPRGK
jgi:hypothetical protein